VKQPFLSWNLTFPLCIWVVFLLTVLCLGRSTIFAGDTHRTGAGAWVYSWASKSLLGSLRWKSLACRSPLCWDQRGSYGFWPFPWFRWVFLSHEGITMCFGSPACSSRAPLWASSSEAPCSSSARLAVFFQQGLQYLTGKSYFSAGEQSD